MFGIGENRFYYHYFEERFDWLRRWWFESYVDDVNIKQCPRCRGTDMAREVSAGFAITLFRCDRCDQEWWT